jgi:regulator of RNase E activity RraA
MGQQHLTSSLLDQIRLLSTSLLSDNLERMSVLQGLSLRHLAGARMVGTALTVKTRAGDNKVIHEALDAAMPGQVLVVDGEGDVSRALVGEIMMEKAIARGVVGFVIDGAIRDSEVFAEGHFPCFAKGVTHRGPYKSGPGAFNIPISVGGWVVNPGDVVVGDHDGVVTFSPSLAEALVAAALMQKNREEALIADIRAKA